MVFIQAIKKRGFLRQIVEGAKKNAAPLLGCLVQAQANVFSPNFQRGRLMIATSGSGQSGSFEISSIGKEFTQDNIFALTEELCQICENVIAANSYNDNGDAANTDLIYNKMKQQDGLADVETEGSDFTLIGWNNVYGGYSAQI